MSAENPSVTECSGSSIANSRCLYSIRSVLVLHSYSDPIAEVLGAWGWVYVRGQRERQLNMLLAGSLFFAPNFHFCGVRGERCDPDHPVPMILHPSPSFITMRRHIPRPWLDIRIAPPQSSDTDALFPTVPRTCFPANNGRWSRV